MRWPWQKQAERKSSFLTASPFLLGSDGGIGPAISVLLENGSEAAARKSPAVMAIVNWAISNFPEPPLCLWSETDEGPQKVQVHPALELLVRPDRETDKTNFTHILQVVVESLVITGNAYVLKLRGSGTRVIGLMAIPASYVTVRQSRGVVESYTVRAANGTTQVYPPEDIIHVREGQDPQNPCLGRSRLAECASAVATDRGIAAYTMALLKAPAPSYLIMPKGDISLSQTEMEELKKSLVEKTTGNKAGQPAFLPTMFGVEKLTFSPDELALTEIHKYVESQVASIFGIAPVVVGMQVGLERSTFANYAEANEAAVEQFLIPKWRMVEEAFTAQLLPEFPGGDVRFAFDISRVRALQDDKFKLMDATTKAFAGSVIDRATWKRLNGMTPGADDEGVYAWMLKGASPVDVMAKAFDLQGARSNVPD